MNAKKSKRIRRIARNQYEFYYSAWIASKPSKWRIFEYLKWKKRKPVYENYEKLIKNITNKKIPM